MTTKRYRRLIIPFRESPYVLARGRVDIPGPMDLHPSTRRQEIAWRRRYGHLDRKYDHVEAYRRAVRIRDELRAKVFGGPVPKSLPIPGICNWTYLGPRNVGGRLTSIAVHPTDPDTLWVGAADGGVWRTHDAGMSWTQLFDDQDTLSIGAVAVAPSDPQRVYVGTGEANGNYDELPGTGLYRSDDGGDSWSLILGPADIGTRISTIWVHPADRDLVLVGSPERGVWRTDDGGATWGGGAVLNVAAWQIVGRVDAGHEDLVYCAVSGTNDLIRRSDDFGATWPAVTPGLNVPPDGAVGGSAWRVAVALCFGTPDRLYVRANVSYNHPDPTPDVFTGLVFRSDDGGDNWNAGVDDGKGYGAGYMNVCAVHPDDPDIVYGGNVDLARSDDGGATFSATGGGTGYDYQRERFNGPVTVHADQHDLVFAPRTDATRLYAATDGGLYVSHFGGAGQVDGDAWVKRNHGLNATQFGHLGLSPTTPSMLGGGTQDNGTPRTLGGLTWRIVYGGDGGIFEVNPTDPAECFFQYLTGDLRRSQDGGRTQASFNAGLNIGGEDTGWLEVPFAFDPSDPTILYSGTSRVYRSENRDPWVSISNNLAGADAAAAWEVLALVVVDPNDTDILWAGTNTSRVWRASAPNAASWVDRSDPTWPAGCWIGAIEVQPGFSDEVYVAITGWRAGQHVYFSDDGGNAWNDISGNLPDASVNCLAIDPWDVTRQTLYVGTDVGVFRTTDRGANWMPFDAGLPPSGVQGLRVHADAGLLRAATHGRGMWEIPVGPLQVAGCSDTQLYVRSSQLDMGRGTTPSQVPDPDRPGEDVYWWESPDIKVDAEPFQAWSSVIGGVPTDVTNLDGVLFDAELVHNFPRRQRLNRAYLQVHNRGPFPLENVRCRLFWADATLGLPAVPEGFFTGFDTWGDTAGEWTAVGPTQTIESLAASVPRVLRFDWDVPESASDHSCLLALVTSDADPITAGGTSVDAVVPTHRHVALRNVHVVDFGESGTPGDTDPTQYTDDNAPLPRPVSLLLRNASPRDTTVGLRIERDRTQPSRVCVMLPSRWIDRVEVHGGCLTQVPEEARPQVPDGMDRGRWICMSSRDLVLDGIEVPAGRSVPVAVAAAPAPGALMGVEQRVKVIQVAGKRAVGGSTLVLRTGTPRKPRQLARLVKLTLERLTISDDHDLFTAGEFQLRIEALAGTLKRYRTYRSVLPGCRQVLTGEADAGVGQVFDPAR